MKIAITGTMGSGKSQVLDYLKDKGFPTSNADAVVDSLYRHDPVLIQEMVTLFSPSVLTNGVVDKRKLREDYFKDKNLMNQANDLIHRRVYEYIKDLSLEQDELIFFEVPLLFETNKQRAFDEIWFIHTNDKLRLHRLRKYRQMDWAEIEQREQYHMKPLLKKFMSDVIISNDADIEQLHKKIDEQLERILHDFKQN